MDTLSPALQGLCPPSPGQPGSPSPPCRGGGPGRAGLRDLPARSSLRGSKGQVSPAAVSSSKSVLVCVQNGCLVPAAAAAAVSADGPLVGICISERAHSRVRCCTSPPLVTSAYSSQRGASSPSLPAWHVWLCGARVLAYRAGALLFPSLRSPALRRRAAR